MKNKIIAKRYADAFMAYCKAGIGIPRAAEELKETKLLLSQHPELAGFLNNPDITLSEKNQVIDKVLGKGFCEETRIFLKLLLEKWRIDYIMGICDYAKERYSHEGAVEALLKTTYPLDIELISEIKEKLKNKFKKQINLVLELDPDLLGCIQIRAGNFIIDGSVRRRLKELKEELQGVGIG